MYTVEEAKGRISDSTRKKMQILCKRHLIIKELSQEMLMDTIYCHIEALMSELDSPNMLLLSVTEFWISLIDMDKFNIVMYNPWRNKIYTNVESADQDKTYSYLR